MLSPQENSSAEIFSLYMHVQGQEKQHSTNISTIKLGSLEALLCGRLSPLRLLFAGAAHSPSSGEVD